MIYIVPPAYSVPNIPVFYLIFYLITLWGFSIQSLFNIVLCEMDAAVLFANLLHQLHYFQ